MRRAPRPQSLQPPAAPPRPAFPSALLALTAAVVSTLAYRGTLAYFFAQDDFTGLARARGLLPRLDGPWRYVSGQLYFDVMARVGDLHPLPYHLASLAAHAACTVLVYHACRRAVSTPAAWVGAVFFGTHPALFTAIYSVSGIGEILSALLAVATLLLAGRSGRERWLALPCFTASLLCKESSLLLPLLLVGTAAAAPADSKRPAARFALPLALAGVSAVVLASFVAANTFGVRAGVEASAPYAVRLDRPLLDNLLTYLGWTARIAAPAMTSFTDAVEPAVFTDGILLAAVWLVGLASRELRRRGWVWAGAWYFLLLAPVLPLSHHTYHYYLYAPLMGVACGLAALVDAAVARLSPRGSSAQAATLLCAAAGFTVALNGAVLVQRIERHPFLDTDLRSDPTVDRARIAGNVIRDLQDAKLRPGTSLWFWSPVSEARQRQAEADTTRESYWETNVRSAIYDGLAVRLYHPEVREVRFVRGYESVGDPVRYALYRPDGHLRVGAAAGLDSVLKSRPARPVAGP